jgi:hypothetical protein
MGHTAGEGGGAMSWRAAFIRRYQDRHRYPGLKFSGGRRQGIAMEGTEHA